MHPHAYRLMAGFNRATLAPIDDSGSDPGDYDDTDTGDEFDDASEDEEFDAGDDEEFDEEGDEEGDEPPPQRQQSRGESRQAKLAREARELRDRLDKQERELEALRNGPQRSQPQGETQEQLNARLAAMDPVERNAELLRLTNVNTQAALNGLRFQIEDTADQTSFNGLLSRTPNLAKHADEVEKRLKQYRERGLNIPRADVLKHILGEKAMESAGRSRSRTERQAQTRREAQRGRPQGSRSDGGREDGRRDSTKSARDKRLENLKI